MFVASTLETASDISMIPQIWSCDKFSHMTIECANLFDCPMDYLCIPLGPAAVGPLLASLGDFRITGAPRGFNDGALRESSLNTLLEPLAELPAGQRARRLDSMKCRHSATTRIRSVAFSQQSDGLSLRRLSPATSVGTACMMATGMSLTVSVLPLPGNLHPGRHPGPVRCRPGRSHEGTAREPLAEIQAGARMSCRPVTRQ